MQARQMTLAIRNRETARLRQIEQALRRIETGDYGVCARCEEEIPPARLRVRLETRVCVRCARGG